MVDHGTETDPRAEAALDALRQGRPVPDRRADDRWAAAREQLERLLGDGRRVGVLAAGLVGAVLVAALAWLALRPTGSPSASDDALFSAPATTLAPAGPAPTGSPATTAPTLVVHAAGAVGAPGVYALPAGSRVEDLLARAGGTTADADLDRLNRAAPLADGQRLFVPRRGEAAPGVIGPDGGPGDGGEAAGATAGGGGRPSGPVDLNAATAAELDGLPGIGPATAAAIVDHRQKSGPFASVDALLDVRGIGPAKLEALRDLVTVG